MPIESYATLLNLKLVLPSSKSNYVAIDKGYWMFAFRCRIAEIYFDENWYLRRYLDVAAAVKSGLVGSAREHYLDSGYFEHRMPYQIIVNEQWYVDQYDDVRSAISMQHFESSQEHFEAIGFKEGRHPFPGFSLRQIGAVLTAEVA